MAWPFGKSNKPKKNKAHKLINKLNREPLKFQHKKRLIDRLLRDWYEPVIIIHNTNKWRTLSPNEYKRLQKARNLPERPKYHNGINFKSRTMNGKKLARFDPTLSHMLNIVNI